MSETNRELRSQRRRNHKRARSSSRDQVSSSSGKKDYGPLEQRLENLENLLRKSIAGTSQASQSFSVPDALQPTVSRSHTPPRARRDSTERRNVSSWREPGNSRFTARLELIPPFDGSKDGMTVCQWLDKVNSVGRVYNWDDQTKIFTTISRLAGNAKSWYDCQTDAHDSWYEWEQQLKLAFPPFKGIAAKLKDFVNTERRFDQNTVEFYYEKLRVGTLQSRRRSDYRRDNFNIK
jgi:hypothetical protein